MSAVKSSSSLFTHKFRKVFPQQGKS